MRIEKISSNQIKCVLDKDELSKRHINVSELAYGSDQAQELFKDMMQQASYEFGFESGNAPLMIEAVPLSSDGIMLIITKVDNPDDLEDQYEGLTLPGARTFKKKDEDAEAPDFALPETTHAEETEEHHDSHVSDDTVNALFTYTFDKLDDMSAAAHKLQFFTSNLDRVYKTDSTSKYLLAIETDAVTKADCKVIRGTLSEYGEAILCRKTRLDYFDEHYEIIIKDDAIKKLALI